jgi:hypothetical protein
MTYDDFIFGDRLMEMRVQEEHQQAGARRMAREALGDRKNWISQRWTLVLWRLGNVLERFGHWLQQSAQPTDSLVAG